MLSFVLFLKDDLASTWRVISSPVRASRTSKFDALLHHVAKMVERDVARGLRVVEAAVRVFFYDDRTGRPSLFSLKRVPQSNGRRCASGFPLKLRQHRGVSLSRLFRNAAFPIYAKAAPGHELT